MTIQYLQKRISGGKAHLIDDGCNKLQSLCGLVNPSNSPYYQVVDERTEKFCAICKKSQVFEKPGDEVGSEKPDASPGCVDCHGDAMFSVVCAEDLRSAVAGTLENNIMICLNSLLVACPSCRLGMWTLRNKGYQGYRRNMFPLGDMSEVWFQGLRSHAIKHFSQ